MKIAKIKMKYAGELSGPIRFHQFYPDGTPALQIHDARDGIETLSISLAGYGLRPPEGHVFVKNYSEHEGLPDALVAAGVVEKIEEVKIGYGSGWLCRVIWKDD